MNKILNGKKYNTETATCVLEVSNGYGYGDIYYVRESLYQKRTGEYFMHCEGGAFTEYGEDVGGDRTGGEQIKLLSTNEIKRWVEKNFDGDTYRRFSCTTKNF